MTTSLKNIVLQATNNMTPEHLRLPGVTWTIVTGLHRVHKVWRWFRRGELYTNKKNLPYLTAGHITAFFAQNNFAFQAAARVLLIATRIQQCAEQQIKVKHCYQQWTKALNGNYLITFYPVTYQKIPTMKFLPPSSQDQLKKAMMATIYRVARVGIATFHLVKSTFRLTMTLMDAIDAFRGTADAKQDGMNEIFINAKTSLSVLIDNKELLYRQLVGKEDAIDEILSVMRVPHKAEKMIASFERKSEKNTAKAKQQRALKEVGKRILFDVFLTVGMEQHLPAKWTPDYNYSIYQDLHGKKKWLRYLPKDRIHKIGD